MRNNDQIVVENCNSQVRECANNASLRTYQSRILIQHLQRDWRALLLLEITYA